MGPKLLTIDVGNSAAKLRAWSLDDDGALGCGARAEVSTADADSAAVTEFLAAHAQAEHVGMCSVAAAELTRRWREQLTRRGCAEPELDAGLDNRTLEPDRVGRDRLFAARGALEILGESALVIDVGTAMTVDALVLGTWEAHVRGWRSAAFLGGAITPGPNLLARALQLGTARLIEVEPKPDPAALGRDTRAALISGIGIGLRGAARELALEIGRETQLGDAAIVLTGGARAFVRGAFAKRRVIEVEDLVHLGICAALLRGAGLDRPAGFGLK